MMLYRAVGYRKRTRKEEAAPIRGDYHMAMQDAVDMLRSHDYKIIVITRDSEGADHPANAGKFFLERIVK